MTKKTTKIRLDASIRQNIETYRLNPKDEYKKGIIKYFIPLEYYYCFDCDKMHPKLANERKDHCVPKKRPIEKEYKRNPLSKPCNRYPV